MIKKQGRIDALLVIVVVVLVIFGVVMVFSASYYSTISADAGPYQYLRLSVQWAIAGFVVMIAASFIPYRVYYKLAPLAIAASLVFLIALYTPLGVEINGATRWIGIPGTELTFMPGEFAKVAIILGCAWYYTRFANKTKNFIYGFGVVILAAGVYFLLIYEQPNLSTAVIVAITIVAIMFLAGVPVGYLIGAAVAGGLGIYYMVQSREGEHLSRITGFLDPFSDAQGEFFQTVQGLLALGSGGLTGTGLGNSVQKALWLPYAQNDFIFAIIGEETGFIGCILVIIAFLILVWRCMLIAMRSKDRFAMLIAGGVAVLFALQVGINIGVVTSILPPTGVILPFISYGGNAIILFMFLIGVVLNISKGDNPVLARKRRRREEAA
jgi:cell division protein FtsW